MQGRGDAVSTDSGGLPWPYFISTERPTTPGFPFRITISVNGPLNVSGIMHAVSERQYETIPMFVMLHDSQFHLGCDVELPLDRLLDKDLPIAEKAQYLQSFIADATKRGE